MRLPCTCCGETNIALACSNFAILATTATNRNHTVFRLICTPKETGPIARFKSHATFAAARHYFKPRRNTPRLRPNPQNFSDISMTSPPRPPPQRSRPLLLLLAEHEGLSCRVTLGQHILKKRRHRCHNTQERFWRAVRRSTCVAYC